MVDSAEETLAATLGDESLPRTRLDRGASIGRYVVLDELGAGGMGVVFAAYDPELDRKVALKLLHGELADETKTTRGHARLLREAQAMAKLSHPNVVAIHDVGEHNGRVFLAMEFIEGKTLREWLEASRREWPAVLEVFVAAGRGLAAAHRKGLVHRDFKPENVMIDEDGRVRVMDFGLARSEQEPSPPAVEPSERIRRLDEVDQTVPDGGTLLTRRGAVLGTPAYMAPEQHLGQVADARSDQFAFCVALSEALYGQRPFGGTTLAELALSVTEGDRREPPASSRVPAWLRRVLDRGLAVHPEDRFPNLDELLSMLESWRGRVARTRWLAAGGAVIVLAGAAFGVQQWDRGRRVRACAEEGASIQDTWNADAAESVRGAFERTGLSYAASSYEQAHQWLDRYARAWSAQTEKICLVATVDESMPAEMHARARECMAERRENLGALVGVLQEASPSSVQKAVMAAAGLSDVGPCADPNALAQQPPRPDDLDVEAVAATRSMLARAAALETAGDYEKGLAVAREAFDRAEKIGWAPLVTRAQLRVGDLLGATGAFDEAEQAAEAGFLGALEAGDPVTAFAAASDLVTLTGMRKADLRRAKFWGATGEGLVRRLGLEGTVREAALLHNMGGAHREAAEYDEALKNYERALEIKLEKLGPDHPMIASTLNNIGNVHDARGEFDEALEVHLRALEIREKTLGPQHPLVASSLNGIGNVYTAQGRLEEGLEYMQRALEVKESSLGPDHPRVASSLNNLGVIYKGLGRYDDALAAFERSLKIREAALGKDHPRVARSLVNIANLQQERGDLDGALSNATRALELVEARFGPDHPDVALPLHTLGAVHNARGEAKRALEAYGRALAVETASLGADHPQVASCLKSIGRIHLEAGALEEASEALERAVAIYDQKPGTSGELSARFGLARALVASGGDTERARGLAKAARDGYAAKGAHEQANVDEIDAWLQNNAG